MYSSIHCDVAAGEMLDVYAKLGVIERAISITIEGKVTDDIARLHRYYDGHSKTIIPILAVNLPPHRPRFGHTSLARVALNFQNMFSDPRTNIEATPFLERSWQLLEDEPLNRRVNLGCEPPQAFSVRGVLVDHEVTRPEQSILRERQLANLQGFATPLDFLAFSAMLRLHSQYPDLKTLFPQLDKAGSALTHYGRINTGNTPWFSQMPNTGTVRAIKTMAIPKD